MMDWLAGLATQDQSLESLMARQNLEKQFGTVLDVARLKQQKALQDQAREEKAREFDLRQKELSDAQQQRLDYQHQLTTERQTTEKRNRYNTVHDNLKPGDVMRRGPDFDLMNEFGTGNQFTPDATNPDALIYQKQAYEQAQQKADHERELQDAREKRAKAEEQRAIATQAREDARLKMSQEAAGRAQKAFDARQKVLDSTLEALPPEYRTRAATEAAGVKKTITPGWMEDDEKYQARVHQAIKDVYDKVTAEAVAAGRMKTAAPHATAAKKPAEWYWNQARGGL